MNFLRTLFGPGDVFEVRVLGASAPGYRAPHTVAGYFDYDHIGDIKPCIDALASYAGVYVTINPVNPALLARAYNRLETAQRNAATSDADIMRRRWLFVDIDPVRPAGISATNEEKEMARDTAECLRDTLNSRGWPMPVEVNSGNGYYLLYRVDLPADDCGLIARCLKALGKSMSTSGVHIDTSVSNAARIARIPGTMNRKGDNRPDRPHRMTTALSVPDNIEIVPVELLEDLAGPASQPKPVRASSHAPTDVARPGDLYAATADVPALLRAHGWQMVGGSPDNQQWRRPGKTDGNHSATWNGEVFYVFSSAAMPLEPNTGYGAFGLYTALEHGGDYSVATKTLAGLGFCDPAATYPSYPGVDLSPFLAQFIESLEFVGEADEEDRPAESAPVVTEFPAHLLNPPGFMGEVIAYNLATAPKPQPILALSGAIVLQAILAARKVKTEYGARTNLLVCAVADSGSGKEHARTVNTQILTQTGLTHLCMESLKSGSALLNALAVHPAILFQIDEYGRFLKAIKNPEKNPHAHEIIGKLLTLYGASDKLIKTDIYAEVGKGGLPIQDPHAIIYGTTVQESLYDGLTEESVTDGFLSRTLIFDASRNEPKRRILKEQPIPQFILDRAKWWGAYHPGSGNLDVTPDTVPVSAAAANLAVEWTHIEHEKQKKEDGPFKILWKRLAQNADRLALIYAVSRDHLNPEVDLESAQWAYGLTEYLTQHMIMAVGDNVAAGIFDSEVKRVMKIIRLCDGQKIEHSRLLKAVKRRAKDLADCLDYLIATEQIATEKTKTRGREAIIYKICRCEKQ